MAIIKMPIDVLILFIIIGAIGTSLTLLGWLFSFLTALGNSQYVFGMVSCLFPPASLAYCTLNWKKAAYAGKMLLSGLALVALCTITAAFYDFNVFSNEPLSNRPLLEQRHPELNETQPLP